MARGPRRSARPAAPGPSGHDAVTFTVATNPGAPAGPLNKIASGGELSRFLLALKVCLTSGASGLTLIFDEHGHRFEGELPEYMHVRTKEFPWECGDCDLFDLKCWKQCRAEKA